MKEKIGCLKDRQIEGEIMKEKEARKKQCPIMRGTRPIETGCIASECMMWEAYEYWKDENGKSFFNKAEGRELVEGGECGLKPKECEGCRL